MPLSPGTRLGPYEIVAFLGAGGMGEVYRAQDVRLNRNVAIKVLATGSQADSGLRDRFEREAKAVAALSHPHICTLHDVGRHDGIDYVVMEHLQGETLAWRLAGQRLSMDEAIRLATQLADALVVAHRAGIVHRDLKPGNLMLTERGLVVLDFGLAKLTETQPTTINSRMITDTSPLTGGAILGTLPYMAPEQLEGRAVDARADLFAFGAILYEMLTGRRAFAADSQASLIAAILEREPASLSYAAPGAPRALERLVRRCLAKKPGERWQSARDIADELRRIAAGSGRVTAANRIARRARKQQLLVAAVVLLAAGVAAVLFWKRDQDPPAIEASHRQVTQTGEVVLAAMSPDGRMFAYVTGEDEIGMRVFVRDIGGAQGVEILRRRTVSGVDWLPDGSRVIVSGFDEALRGVWSVPRLGGPAQWLGAAPEYAAYVTVAPDGSAIAATNMDQIGFQIVTMSGDRRQAVTLQGFQWTYALDWIKTDRIALLTVDADRRFIVWTVAPTGANLQRIYTGDGPFQGICGAPDGSAVYSLRMRGDIAEVVRLPTNAGEVKTPEVVLGALPVVSSTQFPLGCTISSDNERLMYLRGAGSANVWRYDLAARNASATRLTRGTSVIGHPSISPDGEWIAAVTGTEASAQVVRIPVGGGAIIPLREGGPPRWSPDGQRLAFVAGSGRARRVLVSDPHGQGAIEIPDANPSNPFVAWLPDGRIAFPTYDARDFRIRSIVDRTRSEERLQPAPPTGWILDAAFSPSGDRVAVTWNRDGQMSFWTLTWPDRQARELTQGVWWPIGWSKDGRWIYAHNDKRTIVRIDANTGLRETVVTITTGSLENGCTLTPDEKSIICSVQEGQNDAWIAENFGRR